MPTDTTKYTRTSDPSIVSETIIQPSTLENIDRAIYEYLDQEYNIFSSTNKGWKKVSVVWISSERSHQIKNKKELRDSNGSLILPLITVERTSVAKDPAKKGIFYGHVPPTADYKGGSIIINKRINQDKTSNFANADMLRFNNFHAESTRTKTGRRNNINFPTPKNKKIVYQVMSIPMPVYLNINYSITLRTEYQQQMNEMLTPFVTRTGGINSFTMEKNDHLYEAFIQQDFSQENNVSSLESDERTYQTKIDINVLGYLIGEDKNQAPPKVIIRENAVQIRLPRERRITEDELEHIDKRGFYRD